MILFLVQRNRPLVFLQLPIEISETVSSAKLAAQLTVQRK